MRPRRCGRAVAAAALAGASLLSASCSRGRDYPAPFLAPSDEMRPSGYRVQWVSYEFPAKVAPSSRVFGRVTFRNAGSEVWHGSVHCVRYFVAASAPLESGRDLADQRLSLQRPVAPGQSVTLERFSIETPAKPGDYILVFDLVNENVAWFSDRGTARLAISVRVG